MPTLTKLEPEAPSSSYAQPEREGSGANESWRGLALAAVVIGCILRLAEYLLNRSLWMDEAYLSLNLLHRSFVGLLSPLDYHQGAPIGFLLLEKLAVRWWGGSEYSLRLVPLLAGIVSLIFFYKLSARILPQRAVPIAVGLMAISPTMIYYSAEVKQYSTEAAIAVLLYWLMVEGSQWEWGPIQSVSAALLGAIAIWMSHSSVFILAGIGVTVSVSLFLRKDWSRLLRVLSVGTCWMASLVLCYLVTLRKLSGDNELLSYWKTNFMPLPPRSVTDLKWFIDSFFEFFGTSAGWKFTGLAALVFLVGVLVTYRKSRERVFVLLIPALFTLLASGLHKYPFGGRLTLFLVPAVLLFVAEGVEFLRSSVSTRLPSAGAVLVALVFLDPAVYALHHFAKPHTEVVQPGVMRSEEIRPVLGYVRTNEQAGDLVYIFYGAEPAFDYYAERDHWSSGNVEIGTASGNDPHPYESDLDRLRGHRVWVVISHIRGVGGQDAKFVDFYLSQLGPRLITFTAAGAEADLYDLSKASAPPQSQQH